MLSRLTSGDIGLGSPTSFAIYSADGKLLLQTGNVITSESVLERLYNLGHREGPEPTEAGQATEEQPQRLFGTASLSEPQAAVGLLGVAKPPALPSLTQKIEFFQLTPVGETESRRVALVGVIPEEALIVQVGRDAQGWLKSDVTYEARLFTGSKLFKFTTTLIPGASGAFECCFLKYPSTVAQAAVRKQLRVSTSFPGKLLSGEYQRPVVEVVVENISSTGAGVTSKEDLLTVGQSARLAMTLAIDSKLRPVTVFAEVRNRRQEGDRFIYGLEFVRLPDDVRREIKDFVLDSMVAA